MTVFAKSNGSSARTGHLGVDGACGRGRCAAGVTVRVLDMELRFLEEERGSPSGAGPLFRHRQELPTHAPDRRREPPGPIQAVSRRKPYLLVRDLDLIKTVMVKDFDSFHDRGFPVDEEAMPLSAHVFNLKGRRWRALRAKMTPAFTSGKMRLMFQLMSDCGHALSRHLDAPAARGDAVEMREYPKGF
ncbi:Cytochrome P450 6a2 [Gryllus bimaculatus]|nr:Cytochrome P450 6a2 [Gryllus bimaculatus]